MPSILAIDTATDACSLALQQGQECRVAHEVIPRQHQQRLFALLDELLAGQRLAELALDAVAFGRGPGSFTGLRIAASFAQGVGFSRGVPVVGLSTLETQARGYLRRAAPAAPCVIASTVDARVGEIYAAFFRWDGRELQSLGAATVVPPEALPWPLDGAQADLPLHCVGSGFTHRARMLPAFRDALACDSTLLPEARDMLPMAATTLAAGGAVTAAVALPDYVQERSGWKTLAEQGKRA